MSAAVASTRFAALMRRICIAGGDATQSLGHESDAMTRAYYLDKSQIRMQHPADLLTPNVFKRLWRKVKSAARRRRCRMSQQCVKLPARVATAVTKTKRQRLTLSQYVALYLASHDVGETHAKTLVARIKSFSEWVGHDLLISKLDFDLVNEC
jgi:hypothetical protein